MVRNHQFLSEIHIDGARSTIQRVTVDECPALAVHHIHNVGQARAYAPFARVRTHPEGSFLLACYAGKGEVLLDGRWRSCPAGWVSLAPPRTLNAFHALPRKPWEFVWVRYLEPPPISPMIAASSPVRVRVDVDPLRYAVCSLLAEVRGGNDPRLIHHLLEAIQCCVLRVARPRRIDERLREMWEGVAAHLDSSWNLWALAREAHCSTEHLRRRCLRELGRTPMEQLTNLRMQRAIQLLENTDDKLETIATSVGYNDAVVFSKTFKRWLGLPPSEYRDGRARGTSRRP